MAVLPVYFSGAVMPAGGLVLGSTVLSGTTLWGLAVGVAAWLVFALSPWLGAMADRRVAKKRFLAVCCGGGSLATMALGLTGPGDVWLFLALFILAQACLAAGNVFYDAFLPHVAPPGQLDAVSARGFAYGYVGGGLEFAVCLALMALHGRFGLTMEAAARLSLVLTGLWWGGFSLCTLILVPEPRKSGPAWDGRSGVGWLAASVQGVRDAWAVFRRVLRHRNQRRFLLAYFFFNDGIQTAIFMATIYGKEELGLGNTVLMVTLLVIQFVAYGGALLFGRLGQAWGAKDALALSLAVWIGIVLYASVMSGPVQYFILGVAVGLVLGGSQALSRSLFAAMIPADVSASYFGFFSVMTKLSSVIGPFVFAAVRQATGSSRPATLALAVFFVAGLALLWGVDNARQEASNRPAP